MSHQGPPPEAVRKLPIFQTVAEAYGMVFSHLPSLAKAAALPFAISLGISFMAQTEAISPERFVLVNALNLFPEAYFGVAWIRFVLLGARRAAPTTLPPIMPRHLHFLRFAALMMLLTALPGLGIMAEYRPLAEFDGDPSPDPPPAAGHQGYTTIHRSSSLRVRGGARFEIAAPSSSSH